MLAFIRNKFAGSYRALSRASPAYFSGLIREAKKFW
jgi:hypothetical protein